MKLQLDSKWPRQANKGKIKKMKQANIWGIWIQTLITSIKSQLFNGTYQPPDKLK